MERRKVEVRITEGFSHNKPNKIVWFMESLQLQMLELYMCFHNNLLGNFHGTKEIHYNWW